VHAEAHRRGYRFDRRKLRGPRTGVRIRATRGQLHFEWLHLRRKLRARAPAAYRLARVARATAHPFFRLIGGPIASWEVRSAGRA